MSGAHQYFCDTPGRVQALREAALQEPPRLLNGIHFLEVAPGHRRLEVHFVHPLESVPAEPLGEVNLEIRGGVRVRDPQVTHVEWAGEVMLVDVAAAGDFSRYTLRLVAGPGQPAPPEGIDPALAQIAFSFKVDCPSDFDCRTESDCVPRTPAPPAIDYLARDYAGFRRLLLDRMSVLMPGWRERNPADLMVTLAEAVAFRADELAYLQDAVATESTLGTARQRVSVRRHTRLLDYPLHDGCNARTWVALEVAPAADGQTLAGCDPDTGLGGAQLLTRTPSLPTGLNADAARAALDAGARCFELVHPLTVYAAHNRLRFHTWSDEDCCLPQGATSAFLRDDEADPLRLRVGDLVLLESLASPTTGEAADADHRQRQVVRLTRVDPESSPGAGARAAPSVRRDPVTGQPYVEITWAEADALTFDLCLSRRIGGAMHRDLAGGCANVALADHGRSASRDVTLRRLPGRRAPRCALDDSLITPLTQQARTRLRDGALVLLDADAPAAGAVALDELPPSDVSAFADVRPALDVRSQRDQRRWTARRDLLTSDRGAYDYVVETENRGRAVLRFGDGVNGRAPAEAETLVARLRVGNGVAGNVGAEAIAHVVAPWAGDVLRVRNPLPARGGVDGLSVQKARLDAPHAFRRQERAVTPADYAAVAERAPGVQRAVATRRWTGSWHTLFISVDRRGEAALPAAEESALLDFVERFRLAGHDVEIDAPSYVALDIGLHVCTLPGYFAADVERRLLRVFSAGRLGGAAGDTGFFHADRFSFGQPVYLSSLVAAAMAVPGVAYVRTTRFQRLGRHPAGELASGRIAMARLEIARLDNDPNAPENGRIRFDVESAGTP
ncbi:putative baseplate assembly protein [Xylophilus sp. GOD-11R]|uniref:putative baseplate assembly protein n=1 Tax=Xylophilus sp. GOD-11R TaxID=3089814 RepID=UPI00298D048D|nr:putative baseplate assembly protein [Xylophilus sp. GOD-11R]WPB55021.1 putative baseplate assembly protein [Xylophilus sp. GOD-11R]